MEWGPRITTKRLAVIALAAGNKQCVFTVCRVTLWRAAGPGLELVCCLVLGVVGVQGLSTPARGNSINIIAPARREFGKCGKFDLPEIANISEN